ncbi:MAG: thioredoxin-related protein [Arcticibacterium sp.]|jgi:thioredoxin-related protein
MKTLFTLFICTSLFFSDSEWSNDIKQAKEVAASQNKLILLNFSGSDWCAPCIMLKRQVFASSEFEAFSSERLVLLRADFPRLKKNKLSKAELLKNEALAEMYNPDGNFPFTVLLDAKGQVLKSWDGYNGKKEEVLADIIASAQ